MESKLYRVPWTQTVQGLSHTGSVGLSRSRLLSVQAVQDIQRLDRLWGVHDRMFLGCM